ncbi:murein biosynthesis integral membrane protein MurJ, partial [Acidimicrobiaceae bacterium USS-CC1]|nr:murein biosynthesis integral membrane protein MurJ [Acidiferrimicrobium australe]
PARPAVARRRRSLGADTSVLAAGTLLSRLTGFLRVMVVIYLLGVGHLADAYNFANAVPNTLYDLLLGGVLAATLIPLFVDELRAEGSGRGDGGIQAVLGVIAVALVGFSLLLWLLAPEVAHFYLLLSSSRLKGAELSVATRLLQLFAPQIFFLGAIVVSEALLQARRRFAAAAFSPVANNLIAIAALLATGLVARHLSVGAFAHGRTGLLVLGVGTTVGYMVQFLVQVPAMVRAGVWRWPRWAPRHPAVRRMLGLSSWLIGVVVANQIAYNLVAVIALRHKGGFTVYTAAFQFFQLPYALFAVSIASAIMPDLAERWSDRDHVAFLRRVILGVRTIFAVLVPAAVGYAIVARPVIQLLAHHGAVSANETEPIGTTLLAFAVCLPGFSLYLPLVRALQAMKNTRAMFFVYALENGLTVALAFPLDRALGVPGLALAWAAPYTLASIAVVVYLHRHVGNLGGVFTGRTLVRVTLATAAMAVVMGVVGRALPHHGGDPVLAARLVAEILGGGVTFAAMARLLGISELEVVLGPVLRRLRPAAQG